MVISSSTKSNALQVNKKKRKPRRIKKLESSRNLASPVVQSTTATYSSKNHQGETEQVHPPSACGLDYGHVSVMGRRRTMEDALMIAPPEWLGGEYAFFAVYNGHGGAKVAETFRNRLHKYLEKHINDAQEEEKGGFDWEEVMMGCFRSTDGEIVQRLSRDEGEKVHDTVGERMMGSTVVVVLVGKKELVVANCGDSRAVLCRGGDVVPLSTDHKVTCRFEKSYRT